MRPFPLAWHLDFTLLSSATCDAGRHPLGTRIGLQHASRPSLILSSVEYSFICNRRRSNHALLCRYSSIFTDSEAGAT
ncbi:hypothetical protein GWI33_021850 [Rhynchophorus ferrugineus]|uniref:Secreted protein n=1 Tax=Rhynchophorus ferrugineus TaxID=354439 RepID=A0A834MIB9_RHYFE|nr:hypothetical protein GWI33_021850 [Rhynchophorus ferrugineus]